MGLVQDQNRESQCIPPYNITDTCPQQSGTYYNPKSGPCPNGDSSPTCCKCDPACDTCTGPLSTDCIRCSLGRSLNNKTCFPVNSTNGVCEGAGNMVDNRVKGKCDSKNLPLYQLERAFYSLIYLACPGACNECSIPLYGSISTAPVQCTDCLPGFALSNGTCTQNAGCASGSIPSQDGSTCLRSLSVLSSSLLMSTNVQLVVMLACSPSCTTCKGTINYCLTCPPPSVAYAGQCLSSCPNRMFNSNNTCLACHPNCQTCSGPDSNNCQSCAVPNPVLVEGSCSTYCGTKDQYWNQSTSSCESCDQTCSSCSGSGPQQCLSCPGSTPLQSGSCSGGAAIPPSPSGPRLWQGFGLGFPF